MTIQEVQQAKQVRRGAADDAAVLDWAKEFDPQAEILQPDVSDGEAIVFDGRIWHGSCNRCDAGTRRALLLQYASAEAPVFMPDPAALEWPFKFNRIERPPVILVSGAGNGGGNRQVPPPPTSPKGASMLNAEAQPLTLPLVENRKNGWQPHPLFNGVTGVHDHISCHASVLGPGKIPHPPHSHLEEEILIVLDGEAELLLGDGPEIDAATAHPVRSGMFAYYPAYRHHTLRNSGSRPLSYLMFKWRGPPVGAETVLSTQIIDTAKRAPESREPFRTSLHFEGPTNLLGKLHVHLSEVDPGGGYAAHRDEHDVAIVVLSGAIETLGRRVEPFGVVYYRAGERHGLRGIGCAPARYLVFEFHGDRNDGWAREKTCGAIPYQRRWLYRQAQQLSEALPAVGRAVPRPVKDFVKYVLD